MNRLLYRVWVVSAALSVWLLPAACGNDDDDDDTGGDQPFADFVSERYSDEALWACRGDLETDFCREQTEIADVGLDNEPEPAELTPASDPPLDCFYIYPTVDLTGPIGNHMDLADWPEVEDPLLAQAAPLTPYCRVFAPYYRQITIGTFSDEDVDEYLEFAYADVEEAFKHYMGNLNDGRPLVMVGHSQGSAMTTMLLQRLFDDNEELKRRLVIAMPIGGRLAVERGSDVGGSFRTIPVCTEPGQTGCVVGWRTYGEGFEPPENGMMATDQDFSDEIEEICVNPAALSGRGEAIGDGYLRFDYSLMPLRAQQVPLGMNLVEEQRAEIGFAADFARLPELYAGRCTRRENGQAWLEVKYAPKPGDQRPEFVPFDEVIFSPFILGLHILDFNFPMSDLQALLEERQGFDIR